jgi:hypothetical protein
MGNAFRLVITTLVLERCRVSPRISQLEYHAIPDYIKLKAKQNKTITTPRGNQYNLQSSNLNQLIIQTIWPKSIVTIELEITLQPFQTQNSASTERKWKTTLNEHTPFYALCQPKTNMLYRTRKMQIGGEKLLFRQQFASPYDDNYTYMLLKAFAASARGHRCYVAQAHY